MSRLPLAFTLLTLLALLAAATVGIALAQSQPLAQLLQPMTVNLTQSIPISLTLAIPLADGAIITATTPLTIGLALQLTIDGPRILTATVGAPGPVTTTTEPIPTGETQTDRSGRPYIIETVPSIALLDINSERNALDGLTIVGEVQNVSDAELKNVSLTFTYYDANGDVVAVGEAYTNINPLDPGQTSPFTTLTTQNGDDITSYRVQVED